MMLAIANVAISAQNCLKLPNQLVQETLKFHQKLRFWLFSCVEGAPNHVHTVWIFKLPKNFPYAFFNVKNQPLYVNFSIPLCAK
jgi:hypothetical protein